MATAAVRHNPADHSTQPSTSKAYKAFPELPIRCISIHKVKSRLIPFRVSTARNIHERKLIGILQRGDFKVDIELRPI